MDTRTKILTPEAALAIAQSRPGLTIVTGYFDPLLAGHARRLQEIAAQDHDLMVIVNTQCAVGGGQCAEKTLPVSAHSPLPTAHCFSARARAEMVAALAVVEYAVVPEAGREEEFVAQFAGHEIIREEEADRQRIAAFIHHVRQRLETV